MEKGGSIAATSAVSPEDEEIGEGKKEELEEIEEENC